MELNVSDKTKSNVLRLSLNALFASFCKGFALGISLGVTSWLKTLIIESDSLIVLTIKDILLPIGSIVLFYSIANKILIKLGLTAKLTSIPGQLTSLVIGIVGFITGMFLYVLLEIEVTTLSQASTGNEITFEFLLFLCFVASILFIYKILRI